MGPKLELFNWIIFYIGIKTGSTFPELFILIILDFSFIFMQNSSNQFVPTQNDPFYHHHGCVRATDPPVLLHLCPLIPRDFGNPGSATPCFGVRPPRRILFTRIQ